MGRRDLQNAHTVSFGRFSIVTDFTGLLPHARHRAGRCVYGDGALGMTLTPQQAAPSGPHSGKYSPAHWKVEETGTQGN